MIAPCHSSGVNKMLTSRSKSKPLGIIQGCNGRSGLGVDADSPIDFIQGRTSLLQTSREHHLRHFEEESKVEEASKERNLSQSERRLSSYVKHSTTVVLADESCGNEEGGPQGLLLAP